jgi:hypothetical protein
MPQAYAYIGPNPGQGKLEDAKKLSGIVMSQDETPLQD